MRLLFLILAIPFSFAAQASPAWQQEASGAIVTAGERTGREISLVSSLAYGGDTSNLRVATLEFSQQARSYGGPGLMIDTSFGFRHLWKSGASGTIEALALVSPDAEFVASAGAGIEYTHYAVNDQSYSVALELKKYREESAVLIRSGWRWPVSNSLVLSPRLFVLASPKVLASGLLLADYLLNPQSTLRASLAAGQSYEGIGIVDRFSAFGTSFSHKFNAQTVYRIGIEFYGGDLRKETRYTVGLGWTL